jgi:glycosyltransferase involved in cell wall biosynthesis
MARIRDEDPVEGPVAGSIPAVSHVPQDLRVLVIVPAWNEQESIAQTLREIRDNAGWADLLVVDDGSGDRTADTAAAAGAMVCRLPFNLGVGGAMRAGYRYALRNGYDIAVQIDADGQHDPQYLAPLIRRLQDADVVIGARFATAEDPYKVRGPRRWAMVLLAWVLSRLAHTRLTDVTSGFRVSNRRAIALFAQHYPAEYLGDTVESLVIAARAGCRIRQEGVTMRPRSGGRASHSPVKASIYLFRAVVALLLALVRDWPAQFDEGIELPELAVADEHPASLPDSDSEVRP